MKRVCKFIAVTIMGIAVALTAVIGYCRKKVNA